MRIAFFLNARYLWILMAGFVLCVCGVWDAVAKEALKPSYKTGVIEASAEEKIWAQENSSVLRPGPETAAIASALPALHKNLKHLPVVGRQAFGACAAWAIVYYQKTYLEAKEHDWFRPDPAVNPERVSSPAFSYNLLNGGIDGGSSMIGNYQVLTKWGAATCRTMNPNWDYLIWPGENQWRDAPSQRIEGYSTLAVNTPEGLVNLKAELAAGNIATFVMVLRYNFVNYPNTDLGVRDDVLFRGDMGTYVPPGAQTALHALTVIGYNDNRTYRDDSGVSRQGAFLVVNSWGQNWGWVEPNVGTGGFIWISYDCFMNEVTDGVVYFMNDRINYTPTDFAVIDLSHGRMVEVGAEIKGGDFDDPLWTYSDCIPRTGGVRPLNARMVIDITDYAAVPTYSYWFTIHDLDVPGLWRPSVTGMVHDLRIEKPGFPPWISMETPHPTIEMQITPYVPPLSLNVSLVRPKGAVFEEFEMGLAFRCDSAWGDLDNDGAPDFIFQGYHNGRCLTRVYRNNGDGTFSHLDAKLPGYVGALALGDYNNDGFLDVALSGYDGVSERTVVYRNENGVLFTDSGISLPETSCELAWVDYDADGWLDLAVYERGTGVSPNAPLRLFKNDRAGGFSLAYTLTVPAVGQMAWGDYNRDGMQDVAVSGQLDFGGYSDYVTQIFQNHYGSFLSPITLGGWHSGLVAWGDYDNDGWLDLAGHNGKGITIFRNNAGVDFTDLDLRLGPASLMYSKIQWGDVDGNGFADLLVSGDHAKNFTLDVEKSCRVYANQGNGQFIHMGLHIPGISYGRFSAVDYDSDGDLDLCVHGLGESPYPLRPIVRVFENQTGDYTAYDAPSVPTGLTAEWTGIPDLIHLKWAPSTDSKTASPGLYYNVRAGRNPYSDDYVSGAMSIPMRGNIVRPTLSPTQLGLLLYPAPPMPFFWSVQAIDPGLQSSAWSKPSVVSEPGTLVGDVNQDGKIGVADLVKTIRMSKNIEPPDLARADRNNDSKVDTMDVLYMRRLLLLANAPDPGMVAAERIGPEGGTLSGSGFKLIVPPGAFNEPHDLVLHQSHGDRPFGLNSISPTYSLAGAPVNFSQDLQIEVQSDIAPGEGKVRAMLADITFVKTLQQPLWTHEHLDCEDLGNGKYRFTLSAPTEYVYPETVLQASMTANGRDVLDMAAEATPLAMDSAGLSAHPLLKISGGPAGYDHQWRIGLSKFTGEYSGSGGHFRIYYTSTASHSGIENLATYLEEAYTRFSTDYGFSYAQRTKWPVDVSVYSLAPTVYGYAASSVRGNNYGYMEFNEDKLGDTAAMRMTGGHEFFHLVQALYDPRNRFSKAKFRARHLWLDEAMSTWSEGLFPPNPSFTPPFFTDNRFDLFDSGMHLEGDGAGFHGYGLSCLVKYLVGRQGNMFPRDVYKDILANHHPVEAISRNSPDPVLTSTWYTNFVSSLLEGDVYNFSTGDIAALIPASTKRWRIEDQFHVENTRAFYGQQIPDLGAALFMATPLTGAPIPADASYCATIYSGDDSVSCNALLFKVSPDTRTHLGFGRFVGQNRTKIEMDNFTQVAANQANILLNVVNDRKAAPYTKKQSVAVVMGLGYNRTIPLTPVTLTGAISFYSQFPSFTDAGSIQGKGMLNVQDSYGPGLHFFRSTVMGAETRTFTLNYGVTPVSTVLTISRGADLEEISFLGIETYRLSIGDDEHVETPAYVLSSPTGEFQFDINPERQWVTGYVEVFYTASRRLYTAATDSWTDPTTKTESFTALVLIFNL